MLEFKKTPLAIAVQGYKGGGGRTPVEAANTLQSRALANILDLVSEGPIVGLADGLKSVYLDETPVENSNGSRNFTNFQVDYRFGTPDQSYIPNFDSVENELNVGVELKYEAPFIRAFANTNLDAIRIRLSVAGLSRTNKDNGDISGYYVGYTLAVSTDNGPYVTVETNAFNGKTMSKYERDHKIDLPPATLGWSIRVTRTTPNATVSEIVDKTYIESVVEVIEAKLRYPNSALIGVTLDAAQFPNIPSRAYDIKGRIIRVPTNYNPETRVYNGTWDGTFKLAWTNNPAWIYYDLATHPRYGLGHLITDLQVNKWVLYTIGQYCDQLVPDGRGGQEPRFTCNLYLQKQADAYKVLQDLATAFRGIAYWAGGEIRAVADRPEDPVFTYSPANVIQGRFTYEGSARKTRYNVALVSWNDMTNMGRAAIEYVDDPEGIARYGIQQTDASAIGCTSQGQAQRIGRYLIATSQFETQTVTFSVGLDGTLIAPGKIVLINDPLRAGVRLGGRIMSVIDRSNFIVDGEAGQVEIGDTMRVVLPDGTMEARTVSNIIGNQIIVSVPFTVAPAEEAMWSAEREEVAALRYRIISVTEDEPGTFAVTAVRHVEGKFANADEGVRIDPPREQQMTPPVQDQVTELGLTSYNAVDYVTTSQVVVASWTSAKNAVKYQVEWKRDSGPWTKLPDVTDGTLAEIRDAWAGVYLVRVRAVNSNDILSAPVTSAPYNLSTLQTPPGAVSEVIEQVEENYAEQILKDAENAKAISEEIARATAKDAELVAADAAEAAERAQGDADNAQAIVEEAINRQNAIDAAVTDLEAQIANIDLGDILGADKWDQTKSYLATMLVVADGKLYRAKIDVPANTAITNTTYWEPVGNYAELVDQVKAQAATISQHTSQISNINGQVTSLNTDVSQLKSRVTNAEGTITSNSTAIGALQTNVTNLNNTVTANSSAITQLQSDMTDAKQGIAANAGAITGLTTRVSNAEGLITSQGQAITSVQASLSNIGGDNLLSNSSFDNRTADDQRPSTWEPSDSSISNKTYSYPVGVLPGSAAAVRITATLTSTSSFFGLLSHLNGTSAIKVQPGQKYSLSVWAKADTAGRQLRMLAQFFDSTGTAIGTAPFVNRSMTTDMARYVWEGFEVPANSVTMRVFFRLYSSVLNTPVWMELDNAQLQLGAVATNWMPNAAEIGTQAANTATAVGSLTATVTQQGTTIESQGSAITSLTSTVGDAIASQNVIQNGNFTVDVSDWFASASGSSFSWDAIDRALISGAGSIRVRSQGFVVNPGDKVTISFRHKSSTNTTSTNSDTVGLITDLANPTNWLVSAGAWAGNSTIAGVWTTRSYTWSIPVATARNTTVYLRFAVGNIFPTASATMSLDDIVVTVQGTAAAQAKALQDMNTRVTSAEGTLTSQATAITNLQTAVGNKADTSTVVALTNRVTATEGSISTLNSSVTTLQSNINNIGGDNLLWNSSFEDHPVVTNAPTGWNLERIRSDVGGTFSSVAAVMTGGGKAVRLDWTAINAKDWVGLNRAGPGTNYITVSPNTDYVLSSWVRATAGTKAQIYVQWMNSTGGTVLGTVTLPEVVMTGSWQRLILPARSRGDAILARVYVGRQFADAAGSYWIEIDNVMFQEGLVATAWTPSASEVSQTASASASAITSLTTRMTAAEGTITSQGDSITTLNNRLSGVRALGDNIIPNYNFATGMDWWNIQLNGSSANTVVWGATAGNNGPGVVMTRSASASSSPYIQANEGQAMPIRTTTSANRRTFRGYVWAKAATAGASLLARMVVRTNGSSEGNADVTLTLTTTWTRYQIDWSPALESRTEVIFRLFSQTAGNAVSISSLEVYDMTEQLTVEATASAVTSLTTRVTAAEGAITSQSQSITNLQNSLRSTGKNLILNGLFDLGSEIGWGGSGASAFTFAAGEGRNGSIALKRVGGAGTATINANSAIAVPVSIGKTYRLSCYYKTSADYNGSSGNGKLRLAAQDGSLRTTVGATWFAPDKADWTLLEGTYTVPAGDTSGLRLSIVLDNTAGTIWIDDVVLEEVTAEIANSTALSSLTSTVTTQGGTITSQGQQITTMDNKILGIRGLSGNVLMNSNFATGLEWWAINQGNASNSVVWGATSGDGGPGVVLNRVSTANAVAIQSSNSLGGEQGWIAAASGVIFRVTVRGKKLSGSGNFLMRLYRKLQDGTVTGYSDTYLPNGGFTDTFADYSIDLPALPANTIGVYLAIYVHTAVGSIALDRIEMRNVTNDLANAANASALTALTNRVTATEGSITSQSTSITNLQNSLSAVQSGSPNLLLNPTWVENGANWYGNAPQSYGHTAMDGDYAIMPASTGTGLAFAQDVTGTTPGTYVFSADYYRYSNVGTVRIDVSAFNSANTQLATQTTLSTATPINTWGRLSATVVAPTGTVMIRVRIVTEGAANSSWRRAKLEKNTVATPYSDDRTALATSTAISTLQSTVTQQGNTITAQATSITNLQTSVGGKADASVVVALDAKVNRGTGGGGNLFINSTFAADANGWVWAWNPGGWSVNRDWPDSTWVPIGGHQLGMFKGGAIGGDQYGVLYSGVSYPCVAGSRVIMSARTAAHRCQTAVAMRFKDGGGNNIGEPQSTWLGSRGNGGRDIGQWSEQFVVAVAPPGTVTVEGGMWMTGTGESDGYAWMTQPQLEVVPDGRTNPSPYSPGGSDNYASWSVFTTVEGYVSGIQLKQTGQTSNFTVLADQFRIIKPGSNQRTEYSDGNWRVYDGNGTLRVRMGVW